MENLLNPVIVAVLLLCDTLPVESKCITVHVGFTVCSRNYWRVAACW